MEHTWPHRQWTPLAHALTATGDRWKLLIVLALAPGPARLSRLNERLPGISTGVLEHHLRQMAGLGLLSRQRFREVPPRVEVELTDCGRELVPIASALARWGMRHQWAAPYADQYVDVDALLCQLPILSEDRVKLPNATVEAVLERADDRRYHWFRLDGGRLRGIGNPCGAVTCRIEGDEPAWIAALGPARDYAGLDFNGERWLAEQILNTLPTSTAPAVGEASYRE